MCKSFSVHCLNHQIQIQSYFQIMYARILFYFRDVSKAVDVVTSFASPFTKFYMFRTILQTATFHYQGAYRLGLGCIYHFPIMHLHKCMSYISDPSCHGCTAKGTRNGVCRSVHSQVSKTVFMHMVSAV